MLLHRQVLLLFHLQELHYGSCRNSIIFFIECGWWNNLFNQTGLQNTELGGFRFQTPLSDFVDNIFGRNYENSAAGQRQRLISQQPDNMNPAPVVINNSSTDTSAVQQATAGGNGSANNIPFVPSGNPTNFHLLYSQLQYNVVG